MVASIPCIQERIIVHTRKLVQAGFKVGIVRQIETAALKSISDNKNTGFEREVSEIYTKGICQIVHGVGS
jgi:DNA mismatch repair protein MSH3